MILYDFNGCVLQMRNKDLKFCPRGSNRSRKMTSSRVVLSLKLHQHFKKTNEILGDDQPCPVDAQSGFGIFILSRGVKGGSINHFSFFCKVSHLIFIYIFRSTQSKLQDMIVHVLQMCGKNRDFYFTPWGHMRVENDVFCRTRLVT